ncbi:MAG: hypothetical protein ACI80L_000285 [Pseudohongiellaceae bacterium]
MEELLALKIQEICRHMNTRTENGQFTKGYSGNRFGKPKGCRNKNTKAALDLIGSESEAFTRKVVKLAPYQTGKSISNTAAAAAAMRVDRIIIRLLSLVVWFANLCPAKR